MIYRNYPGRPRCQKTAENFKRGLPKSPKPPPKSVLPNPDLRKVLTRFGVVQMPRRRNPETITAEDLIQDPSLKLIPESELPRPVRRLIEQMDTEPLPDLDPKPELTEPQLCMLQVMAELELERVDFDWSDVALHLSAVRPGKSLAAARRIRDALVSRDLITIEPPRLTSYGHSRLRAQDIAEELWARFGFKEYQLERLEPHGSNPDYDLVFIRREDGRISQHHRHECHEVRVRAKIVVLSTLSKR